MNNKTSDLTGKTAFITGSTRSGIGATTAILLAERGANVVIHYWADRELGKDRLRAEKFKSFLGQITPNVQLLSGTIHSSRSAQKLISLASAAFGTIDILINNAGSPWKEADFPGIQS